MKNMMAFDSRYHLSIEDIEKFIYFSFKSKYAFDFILTGGEPMLWINLEEGINLLKKSPITKTITMFTNAFFYKRVSQKVIDNLDSIRISHYNGNDDHISYMLKNYPDKVRVVERTEFWVNPKNPIENFKPVECMNPERLFYDGKIYACPHSFSIAKKNGSNVIIGKNLDFNFLEGMEKIKDAQANDICSMCISNKKVRNQIIKTTNVNERNNSLYQK